MKITPVTRPPITKPIIKKPVFKAFLALTLLSCMANAEELQSNQTQQIEDNKAVINIQKQPTDTKSKQKQNVKNNWFCVVIQVNGKAVDTAVGE